MTELDAMLALAREVRERAYAPYSSYHVGAVVRALDGELFAGCNVENAAYPQGTCAEAGAIAAMVAAGQRTIVEVLVMGPRGRACTPCGGCRQKLAEFSAAQTPVHICDPDGVLMSSTVGALFPHAFALEASS